MLVLWIARIGYFVTESRHSSRKLLLQFEDRRIVELARGRKLSFTLKPPERRNCFVPHNTIRRSRIKAKVFKLLLGVHDARFAGCSRDCRYLRTLQR